MHTLTPDTHTNTLKPHTHSLANRKNKYKIFKAFFFVAAEYIDCIRACNEQTNEKKKRFEQN